MKRNYRLFLCSVALVFLFVTVIISTGCSGSDKFKSTIAKGMINSSEIRMDMTINEIELKYGQPKDQRNIDDFGYYEYENFSIFFNKPLFYFENVEKKMTDPEENSIAFIRWYQDISIFGAILDLTKMDTIYKKYGDPDKQYYLSEAEDDATYSRGMKMVYISGKYALSYNYEQDSKKITYVDLMNVSLLPEGK